MGCNSSSTAVSVMEDNRADTSCIVYEDGTGVQKQSAIKFKEGARQFHSMRCDNSTAGSMSCPNGQTHRQHLHELDRYLAAVSMNPKILEKNMLASQLCDKLDNLKAEVKAQEHEPAIDADASQTSTAVSNALASTAGRRTSSSSGTSGVARLESV
mmetsp:Transcript_7383/g.16967  ORF Transcript_7383/g.16967 Transcript_7383/m.16967 type:complete len:156 (+) Transcript_7383:92-559(+)